MKALVTANTLYAPFLNGSHVKNLPVRGQGWLEQSWLFQPGIAIWSNGMTDWDAIKALQPCQPSPETAIAGRGHGSGTAQHPFAFWDNRHLLTLPDMLYAAILRCPHGHA